MRSPLLLFAVTSLAGSTLASQQPPKPTPLVGAGGLTHLKHRITSGPY